MTEAELRELYERVPAAGRTLGRTTGQVYRMLQTGELDGLCVSGKWYCERASIARYLAEHRPTSTTPHTRETVK